MADRLFAALSTTEEAAEATGDRAWVEAMLEVETALAAAEEQTGVVPAGTAATLAACTPERFDPGAIGTAAVDSGNPVVPFVAALTAAVPAEAAAWVHWGATSQDVLDTATVLIARRALDLVLADLDGVGAACAALADRHRGTLMLGRTLLQPAVPVTFGLKAATWLTGAADAREHLAGLRDGLAAQLGGAAGTLASLGTAGPEVLRLFADRLGLVEPTMPWHTTRNRVAELGAALGTACGAMGKIALDVALLMQAEVGEASEPGAPGRGGSSAMPHKRNPVGAAAVLAGVRRAQGLVGVLLGAMVQEHERAVGAWQAEWETLTQLLRLTAGTAQAVRRVVEGLEVDVERMRANLDAADGHPMAESLALSLARSLGRPAAQAVVAGASRRALSAGRSLRDEAVADPKVRAQLTEAEVDAALDPASYLGSTEVFIDRALAAHRTHSTDSTHSTRSVVRGG